MLPMASGPRGLGTSRGQERLGRSGGTECECVRARTRATGGGPWWRCGPGRASRCSPPSLSGLRGPLRVLPAARVLTRAGYLPAIACSGDGGGGRGRAPESGPAVPGAPPFLQRALEFWLVVGGAVAPARSSRAIEPGLRALRGSACPAARQLSSRLGPGPRGRPLRRRAWRPPAGGSAWSRAPWNAGLAGRSRGGWSPPAAALQPLSPRPPPPAVARIPSHRLLW